MTETENIQPQTIDPPSMELWKVMKSHGMTYDYETFKNRASTPEGKAKLYGVVTSKNLYKGERSEFENTFLSDISVKKKDVSTSSPVVAQPTKPLSTIQNDFGITPDNSAQEAQNILNNPSSVPTPPPTVNPTEGFTKGVQASQDLQDNFQKQLPKSNNLMQSLPVPHDAELEIERKALEKERTQLTMSGGFGADAEMAMSDLKMREAKHAKKSFENLASQQTVKERLGKGEVKKNENPQDWTFIAENFSTTDPKTQTAIAQYLDDMKLENPQRYKETIGRVRKQEQGDGGDSGVTINPMTGAVVRNSFETTTTDLRFTPKQAVAFAQEAIGKRITEKEKDLSIYASRKKTGKGVVDMTDALDKSDDIDRLTGQYKDMTALHPEEAARQATLKRESENKNGTWNRAKQSVNGAINTLNEAAVSTINFLNDFRKGEGHEYDSVDKLFDQFAEAADQAKGYDASSEKLSSANVIPKMVKQVANMGLLFAGGELYGGGKAGLTLAGMTTQYKQFKDDATEKGLSDAEGMKYAFAQSFIQGLLENVNPNLGFMKSKANVKNILFDAIKASPSSTIKEVVKHGLKEIVGENAQEFMQSFAEKGVNSLTNQALGRNKFETHITADEALETLILTSLATGAATVATAKGQVENDQQERINQLLNQPEETKTAIDELISEGKLTTDEGGQVKKAIDNSAKIKEATTLSTGAEGDDKNKVQEVDLAPTTKAELPNETNPKTQEINEEDLIKAQSNESKPKEAVTASNEPKTEVTATAKPSVAVEPTDTPVIAEEKKTESVPLSTDNNAAVEVTKSNVTPPLSTIQANEIETPEQRTERVNKTVQESGLSKNGQKAVNGILNDTKDARLIEVLPTAEKQKAKDLITEIYKTDAQNAPKTEKVAQEPKATVETTTKKKVLQKGQKVGSNNKNVQEFEPTNLKEEIEQYLAQGGQVNEEDFNGYFGNVGNKERVEKKGWKGSMSKEADSLDKATEGMRFKEGATGGDLKTAFEDILREHKDASQLSKSVQSKHKERKATIEGTNNPYESADYEQAHKDLETAKNKVKDDDVKAYNEFGYNTHELDAWAESDKETAQKHAESLDRILKDPQYTKADGSFDYEKLDDNLKNGFEPDILDYFTQAEQLGLKNKEANDDIRKAAAARNTSNNRSTTERGNETTDSKQGGSEGGTDGTITGNAEGGSKRVEETNEPTVQDETRIRNEGWQILKDKLGERKAKKYFEQVDRLFDFYKDNVIEYRANGVVTEKNGVRTFHGLSDTELKTWRVGFTRDITEQLKQGNKKEGLVNGVFHATTWKSYENEVDKLKDVSIGDVQFANKNGGVKISKNGNLYTLYRTNRSGKVTTKQNVSKKDFEYNYKQFIEEPNDFEQKEPPTKSKDQTELDQLNKRIAAEKNPDKKRIFEKKRKEIENKIKFSQASRGSRTAFVQKGITDVIEQVKKAFPNVGIISDQAQIDAIKQANPHLAQDRGFAHEGKVYIDLALADPTTPVHELAHIWVDLLENVNNPQFEQVKKLIEGTSYYAQAVKDNPTKSKNDLAKEAMVRAIEADAVRALSEGKAKQAITKVKDWMRKFFKIPPTFNIPKMTLEDFVRQANRELLRGTPLTNASSLDIDNLLNGKSNVEFVASNSVMSKEGRDSRATKFVGYMHEYMATKGAKLGTNFQNRIRNADAREKAKVARYADLLRRWQIDLKSDARELSVADAEDLMKREAEVFNGTRVLADIPPHRRKNMENLIESRKEIQKTFLDNMETQGKVVLNQDLNPLLTANYNLKEKTDNRLDEINKEYDALFDQVKGLSEATDNQLIKDISNDLAQKRHDASASNLVSKLNELDAQFKMIEQKNNDFDASKQDLLNKIRDLRDKVQRTQNQQGIKNESINEVYGVEIKALQKAIEQREKDIKFGASKADLNAQKRDAIAKDRDTKTNKITKSTQNKIAAIEREITGRFNRQSKAQVKTFEKEQERVSEEILTTKDPKKVVEKFQKYEAAHEKRVAKIEERKNETIAKSKLSERVEKIKEKEKSDIMEVVTKAEEEILNYPDKRINKPNDPRLDTLNGEIVDLSNELTELLEKKKGSNKEQLLRDIDKTRSVERKAELNKVRQHDTVEIRFEKQSDGTFNLDLFQRDGTKVHAKNVTERDLKNMVGLSESDLATAIDRTNYKGGNSKQATYIPIKNPQMLRNNTLYEKIRSNDAYTRRSYMKHFETLSTENIEKMIGEQAYKEGVKAIKKAYEKAELTHIKVKNTEGSDTVYTFLNESGLESEVMSIDKLDEFLQGLDVSAAQIEDFKKHINSDKGLDWFKFDGTKGRYQEHNVTFTMSKEMEDNIINDFLANDHKTQTGGVSSKKGLDTSMLQKRSNIDPALRGLMGEYTDPIVVATRTLMDAAQTQQKDKYHQMLLSEGLGALFVTKPNTRTGHVKEIGIGEMKTLESFYDEKGEPITKLYTTEEIYDGLLGSVKETAEKLKIFGLSNLSGYTKMALTVLGVDSRTRDKLSNLFRLLEMGNAAQIKNYFEATRVANADLDKIDIKKSDFKNLRIGHIAKELFVKGVPQSFNIIDAVFRGVEVMRGKAYGNVENPSIEALLKELREFDLVDGDIDVQSILQGSTVMEGKTWVTQFAKEAGKTYQKSDAAIKALFYWGEKQKMIERGMSEQDAKEAAAANVRLLVPDYSLAPKIAKVLAVTPIVGNFIMYKTESFRTYANGWALSVNEIMEGQKNGNKAQVKQGFARMGSLSAAVGVRTMMYKGLVHTVMSALGSAFDWDDEKDTEALRKLQPSFAQNSQFIVYGRDKNIINAIDFSFTDPEGDIMKMAIAALRGGTAYEKFTGVSKEFLQGYTDADIALQSILNVAFNKDAYGSKIRNTEDDASIQVEKVISYLAGVYLPKFLTSGLKVSNAAMLDALSEAQKPKGGVNTPTVGNEVSNIFLGVKTKKMDLEAMYKRSYQPDYERIEEAQRIFEGYDNTNSELGRFADFTKMLMTGETQHDKLVNREQRATENIKGVFNDMLPKYQAAKQLGVNPDDEIRSSLLKKQLDAGQLTNPMFKARALNKLNE